MIPAPTITSSAPAGLAPGGSGSVLVDSVWGAFYDALDDRGKLPEEVLAIHGMSGRKYRRFINNLIGRLAGPRYLEIGVWAGSTLCAALHGNAVARAVAIDDWSEFGGPSQLFFANLAMFTPPKVPLSFLNGDFRTIDYGALAASGAFDVYLFDGPHQPRDQYDALVLPLPCLAESFVFIVDDWNWPGVREGTLAAIRDKHLESLVAIEIRTTLDGTHARIVGQASDWHNGYFISVLRKAPIEPKEA